MNRMLKACLAVFLIACSQMRSAHGEAEFDDWMALYDARRFFVLRDELHDADCESNPRMVFLCAALDHAFNRAVKSDKKLKALLLFDDISLGLKKEALLLSLKNLTRLQHYAEAERVAKKILALPATVLSDQEKQDTENLHTLMGALRDVAPQQTTIERNSVLDYGKDGRIPVSINGQMLRIPFDTGANFSVLMLSQAKRLGLTLRSAGVAVETSTDMKAYADLAVADRVVIDGITYKNVVFLVFPDELLTFPGGHTIEGVAGFPLIEAMGEVQFMSDGSIKVPAIPAQRRLQNLAFDQLEPIVSVKYQGEDLICRLDTGADDSTFYEPFIRLHPGMFELLHDPREIEIGGVGGIRKLQAYRLDRIDVVLGGRTVTLQDIQVFTAPITDEASNYLHCNLGRSTFANFDSYIINFRSMSLVIQ